MRGIVGRSNLAVALLVMSALERPQTRLNEHELRAILTSSDGVDEIKLGIWGGYDAPAIQFYIRILDNPKEHPTLVNQVLGVLVSPNIKADRTEAVERVVKRLADPNTGVRRTAAGVIGKIGTARDLVPVTALLADADVTVTYAAARALSEIGDRRSLVALDIWLNSDSHRDAREVRDHVRRFRAELQARLDRTAPPPREVRR